jgi:phosphoadenosine phosphosulfate reductase
MKKMQNEQLTIGVDGSVKGELERKIETAIQRLQSFEPPDGYYVAFSGGKDSQCVYHLCKLGGG